MEKCPECGSDLKYIGKSSKHTAQGHHARVFNCNNGACPRERVLGGWCNDWVIETYKKENRLDKFGYRAEIGPGHLCINEFGKTVQEKIYGTEADAIIESLFMTRYEIFQSGKLTHVTSNYSPSELSY